MRNNSMLISAFPRNQTLSLASLSRLVEIFVIPTSDDIRKISKKHNACHGYLFGCIWWHLSLRKETPHLSTPSLIFMFCTPYPPKNSKIGFAIYSVRPYVPRPRRCFRCQKFSNPQKNSISSPSICLRCSSLYHLSPHRTVQIAENLILPLLSIVPLVLDTEILEQITLHKLDRREATQHARKKLSFLPNASVHTCMEGGSQ